MTTLPRLLPCLLFVAGLAATPAAGQPTEYEVKAAFLFNFARFSEWPAESDSGGSLRICVLGEDPFGNAFDDIIGRPVRQQIIAVVRADSAAVAMDDCHLLFVAASARGGLDDLLKRLAGLPVITVGDGEDFVRRGGMAGFVIRSRKVRFLINPDAAAKVGIRFSSKLLRVAEIYREKD